MSTAIKKVPASPIGKADSIGRAPKRDTPARRVMPSLRTQPVLGNQMLQHMALACPDFSACPTGGACHPCPFRNPLASSSRPSEELPEDAFAQSHVEANSGLPRIVAKDTQSDAQDHPELDVESGSVFHPDLSSIDDPGLVVSKEQALATQEPSIKDGTEEISSPGRLGAEAFDKQVAKESSVVQGGIQANPARSDLGSLGVAQPETVSSSNAENEIAHRAPASALIVEDSNESPSLGQMKKSDFLSLLEEGVLSTVEEGLAGTGRTAQECPYIDYWFGYYSALESMHLARAIQKYAPETATATQAEELIKIILERVHRTVGIWAKTGLVTGIPEGIPSTSAMASIVGGSTNPASARSSGVMDGRNASTDDLHMVQGLGLGRPLESGFRSRVESAFDTDFSRVRVHTDSQSAAFSEKHDARALAIGEHVAFGSGEYRPGTPIGDALLLHELAHVAQQKDAAKSHDETNWRGSEDGQLERDANNSAISAFASLWGIGIGASKKITQNAAPHLRSGLRLQRCSRSTNTPTCVFPSAVQNGPRHSPINTPDAVGMSIDITVIASSGNPADLAGVEDSEEVTSSVDHTGSFAGLGSITGSTSSFMSATGIPPDQHSFPKALIADRADNHGGNGSISFLQLDIFKHPTCGVTSPRVIPSSGYRIRHTITTGPGTKIMCRTEKSAEACTVNGFTARSGPSPTYHEDNEVRA